jgi:hypothetical protein
MPAGFVVDRKVDTCFLALDGAPRPCAAQLSFLAVETAMITVVTALAPLTQAQQEEHGLAMWN